MKLNYGISNSHTGLILLLVVSVMIEMIVHRTGFGFQFTIITVFYTKYNAIYFNRIVLYFGNNV